VIPPPPLSLLPFIYRFCFCAHARQRPNARLTDGDYVAGWGASKAVKRIRLKLCGVRHERDGIHTRYDKCLMGARAAQNSRREA
jgi:hypothetical protein